MHENGLQRYRFGHELKNEIKRLGGTTKILLEDQRDSINSNIRTMKRMLKIYEAVTS